MQDTEQIVPVQWKGMRTGATSKIEAPTRHDAIILFRNAKTRLVDVNKWQRLCGKGSAEFQLTDARGYVLDVKAAEIGNLIRIKLPAPSNDSGDGYDWVRVEEFVNEKNLLKDEEIYGFRVRPVQNPFSDEDSPAHFYTRAATSTFLVIRNANTVVAVEKGRNESPNTGVRSIINKIRNFAVAFAAMIGFSNPQWKCLIKGIIRLQVEPQ